MLFGFCQAQNGNERGYSPCLDTLYLQPHFSQIHYSLIISFWGLCEIGNPEVQM
uniref:Uncharacterized protein n=1 Tax=Anguilla anguilla TaxID=7936 RepID=A0A0E9R4J8_ANGAN